MAIKKTIVSSVTIKTELGMTRIQGDHNGISRISISETERDVSPDIPQELEKAVQQTRQYFSGSLTSFQLKLDPKGTDFQKKVWCHLQQIPFGKTISYLDLAKELGDVKSIRAAAAAIGKNPLWIVIPCHRVIGSDGSLTGYAGGLWRKKWLLLHENQAKQQTLF